MERGPIVLTIFLILSGSAILVMLAVALSTGRPPLQQADVTRQGYLLRRWWFWLLAASIAALLGSRGMTTNLALAVHRALPSRAVAATA